MFTVRVSDFDRNRGHFAVGKGGTDGFHHPGLYRTSRSTVVKPACLALVTTDYSIRIENHSGPLKMLFLRPQNGSIFRMVPTNTWNEHFVDFQIFLLSNLPFPS